MAGQSVSVFLATLEHSRKAEINRVRNIILGTNADIVEKIKWNAPSFGLEEDDRITFRLQPGDKVDLIFHRGVKPKALDGFAFTDETGLLKFVAPDRALLIFSDAVDIESKIEKLRWLVRAWIAAT
jgi:hypothetical protein